MPRGPKGSAGRGCSNVAGWQSSVHRQGQFTARIVRIRRYDASRTPPRSGCAPGLIRRSLRLERAAQLGQLVVGDVVLAEFLSQPCIDAFVGVLSAWISPTPCWAFSTPGRVRHRHELSCAGAVQVDPLAEMPTRTKSAGWPRSTCRLPARRQRDSRRARPQRGRGCHEVLSVFVMSTSFDWAPDVSSLRTFLWNETPAGYPRRAKDRSGAHLQDLRPPDGVPVGRKPV